MQMLLPLHQVDSLVSSSLNMPEHSQQLLDIASAKACIVIPAWRLAQTHPGPEQPTHLKLQLAMGELSEVTCLGCSVDCFVLQ